MDMLIRIVKCRIVSRCSHVHHIHATLVQLPADGAHYCQQFRYTGSKRAAFLCGEAGKTRQIAGKIEILIGHKPRIFLRRSKLLQLPERLSPDRAVNPLLAQSFPGQSIGGAPAAQLPETPVSNRSMSTLKSAAPGIYPRHFLCFQQLQKLVLRTLAGFFTQLKTFSGKNSVPAGKEKTFHRPVGTAGNLDTRDHLPELHAPVL